MPKMIFKYSFEPSDAVELVDQSRTHLAIKIDMPVGAKVVHVGEQRDKTCLWVEFPLESKDKTEARYFYYGVTGYPIPDGYNYLGSVLLADGNFVGHIYEIPYYLEG